MPDTTAPSVQISDNVPGVANRATGSIIYSLVFSEAVNGLTADDLVIANATLAAVSGAGRTWIVTLIPTAGVASGNIGLGLKAGAVSDDGGNPNAAVSYIAQTIDTLAPVPPKIVSGATFNSLTDPQVTMQTTLGAVVFELYPERAPITVANLLAYAYFGFYDNTVFHRVMPGFVAQAGAYTTSLTLQNPVYGFIPIESANGLGNLRGTLAMARGEVANSATTQFFVNLSDNPELNYLNAANPGYAVFGRVLAGLSVMDGIGSVSTVPYTSPSGAYFPDLPSSPVVITSLRQTAAGSSITNVGTFTVSGLEVGAQWAYSLDAGVSWLAGSGSSFSVPPGTYAHSTIQVRQIDAAGNVSLASGVFTTTLTVETAAPTIIGFSPADETNGVWVGSDIVITFSEAVQRGAGSLVLKTQAGATVEIFDVASSAGISVTDNRLTLDPVADLSYGTGYRLEIAAGAIRDLAGNYFGGSTSYNFTTIKSPSQLFAGTVRNDVLVGSAGNDLLSGAGGNDILTGGLGNDIIDGGDGLDQARFSSSRAAHFVQLQGGDDIIVNGPEGLDVLVDVERLIFPNGALAFDVEGTGGAAYRLYQAAFDRIPDEVGLGFWIGAFDAGFGLIDSAKNFIASAEFTQRYGAAPTNNQFTQLLYRNVLHRDPDQAGYDFWNEALEGKGLFPRAFSRAEVLAEFSESAENKASLIGVLSDGFEYLPWPG